MNCFLFLVRVLVVLIVLNGSIAKSLAQTSGNNPAQIITYCQLVKAPSSFVGKRIRVRAVYSYMFEVSRLKSPACCPDRDVPIWVEFNEELEGSSKKMLHKFPKGMGIVLATFEGTLQEGGPYGDGGYRFKFAVGKIENLENKANPSPDHHPSVTRPESTNTRLRLLFLAALGKSEGMRTIQTVGLLVVLSALPTAIRSQGQSVSAPATASTGTYANTTEGLKQLLLDMRTAAKEGNDHKLAAFVKDMEIPNCDAWLHRTYDSDKADSWMGLCEAKSRDPRERDMRDLFGHIAKQDGKITTRKVNDNPQPGKGLEWGWLQAIKQPLDIYWASWLPTSEPKESEADPIGYFMFIDGGFRWESGIQSFKASQTKRAKIVLPQLAQKIDPVYPMEAAANHVSGTVRVYFVIGTDGVVHNPHAIKDAGFSEDPYLVKAAEDAVRQWRYLPLTIDGKPTEMDSQADVVFAGKN